MSFHSQTKESVLSSLSSNLDNGLSSSQVSELQAKYGPNKLREKKKKTYLQRFFDQFKDVMILILIAAAVVSFVIACTGHDPMEFFEPALILLIVVLNAVMGMLQESKAEKALDALPMPVFCGTERKWSLMLQSWYREILSVWKPETLFRQTPDCSTASA